MILVKLFPWLATLEVLNYTDHDSARIRALSTVMARGYVLLCLRHKAENVAAHLKPGAIAKGNARLMSTSTSSSTASSSTSDWPLKPTDAFNEVNAKTVFKYLRESPTLATANERLDSFKHAVPSQGHFIENLRACMLMWLDFARTWLPTHMSQQRRAATPGSQRCSPCQTCSRRSTGSERVEDAQDSSTDTRDNSGTTV